MENSETITVNSVEQTRGTDYSIDYDNGTIQFVNAPGDTLAIEADYTYISGDAVITGEEVPTNAYCDSVALVGTVTGFTGTTDPIIIKLTNCLCDTALTLNLAPKEEAVPEITFSAHYSNSDLSTEPWSITYPSS